MVEIVAHLDVLREILADETRSVGLRHFPTADRVTPARLAKLATECLEDYSSPDRSYRDGCVIRDLVFTLMEEWGWTKERRNG